MRRSTQQAPKSPQAQALHSIVWLLLGTLLLFNSCGPLAPTNELIIIDASPGEATSDQRTKPPSPPDIQSPPDTIYDPGTRDKNPLETSPDTTSEPGAPPEQSIDQHQTPDAVAPDTMQDQATQDLTAPDRESPDLAAPDRQPLPDRQPPPDRGPLPDYVGTPCTANGLAGTCKQVQDCTGNQQATPGRCPGPAGIQCCTAKPPPGTACDPNARPQPNVGLQEAPGVGGCKAGMVPIGSFCIDQYEASLVEVLSNGTTRPWSPYFNPGTTKVRALSIKGAVPQGYINRIQAASACKEAGKRLCNDTEWLRACQSTSKYTYPYGNTRKPSVCNDARSKHPAVEYFKSSQQWVFGKIQHQCLSQLPMSLAKTGSHSGCVTAEKVYDMMGNLHEWTSSPNSRNRATFRGGFYVDTYRNGNGCLYRTTAHFPQHWDYSTGFRCCSN